jgi:uncharacterized protein (TIGR02266 family)
MDRLLPLVREFGALEKRRGTQGVTPREYRRYIELRRKLARHVDEPSRPVGAENRKYLRVPTRLLIEYRAANQLKDAIIHNVSQGGLFISTAEPLAVGAKFTLCLAIGDIDWRIEVPCEVVTNNVANEFSTDRLGMGIKFASLNEEQRRAIDLLFTQALGLQLEDEQGAQ